MPRAERRSRGKPDLAAQAKAEQLLGRLESEMLGDGRRISPVIEAKNGGRSRKVRMVQLSDHRKQLLRVEAMGWVEDLRRRVERKYAAEEIRDGQVSWEDLRGARWSMLIVHAATRKAENVEEQAYSLEELEESGSSDLLGFLSAKYTDFEGEWAPEKVTQEEISHVIELLKKNAVSLPELWAQCGFATLAACMLTMAAQLATLETVPS